MNYQQTVDYLFERLPMFQRLGAAALKPDLKNTLALCAHLGNPQNKIKTIHIAGTNGKGSTSHMLSAIFQQHGFKTGLYTSPHLVDFRERIKINGECIPESEVIAFVKQNKSYIESLSPSFFELTVGLAFQYFADQHCDICIIETGLGGRLDSTNVIMPELSIITNIGHDHMDLLGDTLEKVAFEKAGIIKPMIPILIGENQAEIRNVYLAKAKEELSPIFFAEQFAFNPDDVASDLQGIYQKQNKVTVLAACEILKKDYPLKDDLILAALKNVMSLTGFTGRWHKIQDTPIVICDTGHNYEGIELITSQLKEQTYNKLHMVWGMVKDKDSSKIMPLLPTEANYYFTKPEIPRGKNEHELKMEAEVFGLYGQCFATVPDAYQAALAHANSEDFIFVGGSTFIVADLLTFLKNKQRG